MTTRRGFLQSVSAALGSTLLPGSTVASVLTAAPVTSAAVGVAAVATVAAVARQFKTAVVLDPRTFEPKMTVAIVGKVESYLLGTNFRIEPIIDANPEVHDALATKRAIFTESPEAVEQSKRRMSLIVIQTALGKEGLPPLTEEETALILEQTKETADA